MSPRIEISNDPAVQSPAQFTGCPLRMPSFVNIGLTAGITMTPAERPIRFLPLSAPWDGRALFQNRRRLLSPSLERALLRAMTIETPFDRVRIATAQGADARSAIIPCVRHRPERTAPHDLNDFQTVTHDAANPRQ